MNAIPVEYFLIVAAVLFAVGAIGFLLRRNLLVLLMSIEVMLNAVNLTLVAFNRLFAQQGAQGPQQPGAIHGGQIFAFFIIIVAAAEAALGLAIVLAFFRVRKTVRSDDADLLRN
jgi:NADH-quinone oxidoreductase subunit K